MTHLIQPLEKVFKLLKDFKQVYSNAKIINQSQQQSIYETPIEKMEDIILEIKSLLKNKDVLRGIFSQIYLSCFSDIANNIDQDDYLLVIIDFLIEKCERAIKNVWKSINTNNNQYKQMLRSSTIRTQVNYFDKDYYQTPYRTTKNKLDIFTSNKNNFFDA